MGCFGGGSSGTSTTTVTERQQTAAEDRLNTLQGNMMEATAPYQQATQIAGLKLSEMLLKGQEPLPGYFQELSGGISPQVTQEIVDQSLRDINPSFQAAGIMDSGVSASISARTSADIRRASEEFNIGNRLNLLNLALSGQAQVQSPVLGVSSQLGARLGTLGKTTSTGSSITTDNNTFGRTFMQSFAGSSGKAAGTATVGAMFACWVAKEIYGSWEDDRTVNARFYITYLAPRWFSNFYIKHGEKIARFISDKPVLKNMLKPLFDWFGYMADNRLCDVKVQVA
jgi:hypothetical protein